MITDTSFYLSLLPPFANLNLSYLFTKFDFKYSQVEFVTRLCQLLLSDNTLQAKVHEPLCQVAIKQVNEFISFYHHAYQPYVFIDTGLKRSTQPIFALALCERQRRIKLPKTLQLLANNEQHSIVSELIKQHYQYYQSQFYQSQHAGKLVIWGGRYSSMCSFLMTQKQTNKRWFSKSMQMENLLLWTIPAIK